MDYEPVIGLEIHAELNTNSKMFCRCKSDPFNNEPNSNVCPVCLGMPGSLPVMNKKAVEWVILCGLALNCEVTKFSKWDRKNYFYPDLPKGYQISQYDLPLTRNGFLKVNEEEVRITRIHLEEDTGKLMHPAGTDYSLVDYNRAGVPLMELVTEPDIKSGAEAKKFAQELQLILRSLGISNADMEKGEMRVEVNISIRKKGESKFGTKVEIKNLNSFRVVERAINYEIERQAEVLESGEKVIQETRGWNEGMGKTFSQRIKETAEDYRYFPEPDLPPVEISDEWIEQIREQLTKLPEERRAILITKGLSEDIAQILVTQAKLGSYFEKVLKADEKLPVGMVANWLVHETVDLEIPPSDFARLITLIDQRVVSGTMGKEILKLMADEKKSPEQIIEEKGLKQITGEGELQGVISRVIENNTKAVEDYRSGKEAVMGYLVGQVMRETKGQAEPGLVKDLLIKGIGK